MINNMGKLRGKDQGTFWTGMVVPILIFLCLLLFLSIGIGNVSNASDKESMKILQDAILRATVQCYAIEGMYPPDVKYLEDNYGVTYDHSHFIVHYDVFASNIIPNIKVIDQKPMEQGE